MKWQVNLYSQVLYTAEMNSTAILSILQLQFKLLNLHCLLVFHPCDKIIRSVQHLTLINYIGYTLKLIGAETLLRILMQKIANFQT